MFEDLDRAKSEADNTLALNPNSSGAYVILGHIETLSGRPLKAIPAIERAMRLDPAFRAQHLTSSAWHTCLLASMKPQRLCSKSGLI